MFHGLQPGAGRLPIPGPARCANPQACRLPERLSPRITQRRVAGAGRVLVASWLDLRGPLRIWNAGSVHERDRSMHAALFSLNVGRWRVSC
jgi:hypothetical protein